MLHRVLDVGCGCGIIAAAAAQLVGTTGSVTGMDILPAALQLAQTNVAALREQDDV
jgi:methylase of polypeptide subunit release factors